jgi:hypothetical protein
LRTAGRHDQTQKKGEEAGIQEDGSARRFRDALTDPLPGILRAMGKGCPWLFRFKDFESQRTRRKAFQKSIETYFCFWEFAMTVILAWVSGNAFKLLRKQ